MKKSILKHSLFYLFLCFTCVLSAQSFEETVLGVWSTGDGDNSKVQFYKTAEGFWEGKIIETDVTRSIGKMLFVEGVYHDDKEELKGVLIHPDSGLRVSGTLTLESARKMKVFARKLFIFKTFYWDKTISS